MSKEPEAPEPKKSLKITVMDRLRGYFLAGIVITAPISITIYLTYVFFTFIDSRVAGIIPEPLHDFFYFPGVGVIASVVFFILVGWLARNFLGRLFIRVSEFIVGRMPIIRTVYSAIKQIFETVATTQSQAFRECVMIEYPRKGMWCIGFLTGTTKGEVQRLTDDEVVNIFLPTTPNPTSGFLLFVPRSDVTFLDMSVEEGIKMIVSAGIITPPDKPVKKNK